MIIQISERKREREIERIERALAEREIIIQKSERKRDRENKKSIGKKRDDHLK